MHNFVFRILHFKNFKAWHSSATISFRQILSRDIISTDRHRGADVCGLVEQRPALDPEDIVSCLKNNIGESGIRVCEIRWIWSEFERPAVFLILAIQFNSFEWKTIMTVPPIAKATLQAALINAGSNVLAQGIKAYRADVSYILCFFSECSNVPARPMRGCLRPQRAKRTMNQPHDSSRN